MKDTLGRENGAHGHARHKTSTPTYSTWKSMKRRCIDPKYSSFQFYGARGISLCERWMDFENFLADMGERPEGTTLDRIDNKGHYDPNNCRWADRVTQARNTKRNRIIVYNGESMCLQAWAEKLGMRRMTIVARIARGWELGRAPTPLSKP